MKIDKNEAASRMAHFEEVCRNAGVKLTHQRIEIYREVAQTGDHPDAETIHRGLRKRLPSVSLDTVYRALWLLNDLGLIKTLEAAHLRTRFDANLSRHHHFVCLRCGLMQDFYSDAFDSLDLPVSINEIGQAEMTHVEVRGICWKCAAKQESKPPNKREKETN